jgi:hypothetical protein
MWQSVSGRENKYKGSKVESKKSKKSRILEGNECRFN